MGVPKQRVKTQAATFPVPQSRDDVDRAIARIGTLQRDRVRVHADKDEQMAEINREHKARLEPLEEEIRLQQQGIQIWCESHRAELTQSGKVKFHEFPSGTVKWRMSPPKVILKGIDVLLELLRTRGLDRFIRTKEEVNKEAILADHGAVAGVPGIKIDQVENFIVEPFETKLEEVA
ncbi:MAG: host-nuclease inhibitor Gam family protein [Magnetococcus sp. DMHC-8]